jgi:hypothetical protein
MISGEIVLQSQPKRDGYRSNEFCPHHIFNPGEKGHLPTSASVLLPESLLTLPSVWIGNLSE